MRRRPSVLGLSLLAVAWVLVPAPTPAVAQPQPVTPTVQRVPVQPSSVKVGPDDRATDQLEPSAPETSSGTSPEPFTVFAVTWAGDTAGVSVRARLREAGGWTPWQELEADDAEPDRGTDDARGADGRRATGPLVTPGADAYEVEVLRPAGSRVADAEVLLVDPGSSEADQALAVAPASVASEPAPGIVSRAAWGADESLRLSACPEGPSSSGIVKVGFVHHTAGTNDYAPQDVPAILRGIYAFHVQGRGWCDVGYNFLVDKFGRIFEGRFGGAANAVIGAHTGGFNTDSFGVALLGTFTTVALPPAARTALEATLSWKLGLYSHLAVFRTPLRSGGAANSRYAAGAVVSFPTVSGHRDASFTECPGEFVYAELPGIRARVEARLPSPVLFEQLGGVVQDRPAGASWSSGRLDVAALGVDGAVWHTWSDAVPVTAPTSSWAQWESLGGRGIAGPAVSAWSPGRLDVFVPGTDGAVWHRWYDRGWSSWESLGGRTGAAAASASWAPGRLDLFVRGTDARLFHRAYDGRSWSGWEDLGGAITEAPAAASWSPGRLDVAAVGADGQVWHIWYGAAGWSPWEPLGGQTGRAPGVAAADGELAVLVTGVDDRIWQRTWNGQWTPWTLTGGVATSGPGASSRAGHADVFVRGVDRGVWHGALLP